MVLTDATKSRYSIPESMARKPVTNPTMRLDMCGFELLKDPFGFEFTKDTKNKSIVLSTRYGAFVMYDKYIQMDI
jgi:hypothetical protein